MPKVQDFKQKAEKLNKANEFLKQENEFMQNIILFLQNMMERNQHYIIQSTKLMQNEEPEI